jgi:hypothetical protein
VIKRVYPSRLVRTLVSALFLAVTGLSQTGPVIGIIDFYGNRKVPASRLRTALAVKEGDRLPRSKGDVEERIESVSGVVRARLEATCCDQGKAILYVGIEERGAPTFPFRNPPEGTVEFPAAVHEAYAQFLKAVEEAARAGQTGEDLSLGHSVMQFEPARKVQERFVALASEHQAGLRQALRESSDNEQRAIAAYVLGYSPKKDAVVNDLQYALQDSDDTVRGNAIRALAPIAVLSPTWFVEMLDSIIWTDRNNAAVAMVDISEPRDARVLAHLKERALPALAEMARWKHLPHALPAFILIGRVAGLPEKEIQDAWSAGEREKVIQRAMKSGP